MISLERIETAGITLHCATAGDRIGTPVILLHGFPEAWFCWERQIEALAAAGCFVVAPDQRGYNLSDKPSGVDRYVMANLVQDVLDLADSLGVEKFNLAGHDWGAAVAWCTAMQFPERLEKLAILNVPHPAVMKELLRRSPAQLMRSSYMFFFCMQKLPELVLSRNSFKAFIDKQPADLTESEKARYIEAWSQPGALTCMLNWYRAALLSRQRFALSKRVTVPTLILWGKQDPYLSFDLVAPSAAMCDRVETVIFEKASHWVCHDEADAVSRNLIRHFVG
ncbi:MAG: alpha/beta fold hydrolase [Candidatus Obscuribacterales bacterium]